MFNVYSISSHGAVVARLTVDQSVTCSNQVEETSSRVTQWKRVGLIRIECQRHSGESGPQSRMIETSPRYIFALGSIPLLVTFN